MLNRKIVENTILLEEYGQEILTIQETEEEGNVILNLKGNMRSDIAYDIQDELIALVTAGAKIVVDMGGITHISSVAQHAFLIAQQKVDSMRKGSMILRNLKKEIYLEFEKTGTADLLMIQD